MVESGAQFVFFLMYYAWAALLLGYFAKRKNRSLAWAFIGPLFCVPSLIAMAFMSYLCPKCRGPMTNHEWKRRHCPRCGDLAATPQSPPPPSIVGGQKV
jgi:hypothetical protein